jgi:hypothetical protein
MPRVRPPTYRASGRLAPAAFLKSRWGHVDLAPFLELFLGGRRLRRWKGRGNGRRRDIGNRLLEGVQLFSKHRNLLGKLFSFGLLSHQLVLNDLQLVDGLLLSYPKPLRCLEELVRELLARWGGHTTEAPNN